MSYITLYKLHPISMKREILGTVSELELDFLADNLQEELEEDEEYYIDQDTVDYLRDQGASGHLLMLLEKALEDEEEGIEIVYKVD